MADYKLPIITGTSLSAGDLLRWDGSDWVNYPDSNYDATVHAHDTHTLQLDGINSNGGAFAFTTSGAITFNQNLIIPGDGTIGQAGGPLLTFDSSNNFLEITGCKVGIGTLEPLSDLDVSIAHAVDVERTITAESVGGANRYGLGFKFYTDGGGTTFKNIVEYHGENIYESIRLKLGNVGIGIDPEHKLHVAGTISSTTGEFIDSGATSGTFTFRGTTAGRRLELSTSSSGLLFEAFGTVADDNVDIQFKSEGSTIMTLTGDDKVHIGGTDPKTKLTVEGTLTLKEQASADGDTDTYGQVWCKDVTPNELWFTDDDGNNFQLGAGGGITAFTGLIDTPPNYTGDSLKLVRVNEGETALEFVDEKIESSISFVIDGGGSVITTGIKGDLEVPFDCEIKEVTLLADQGGAIIIDIWNQAYADFPPEDANSITSAAPPTITATTDKSQDSTLTDWTPALTKGDVLRFNVDSVTIIERVTLSLKVDRT